jgi:hypothetical protein
MTLKWKLISVCVGDSANLETTKVHDLRRMYHYSCKSFWTHPMELLGVMGRVESRIGPFGMALVSM